VRLVLSGTALPPTRSMSSEALTSIPVSVPRRCWSPSSVNFVFSVAALAKSASRRISHRMDVRASEDMLRVGEVLWPGQYKPH